MEEKKEEEIKQEIVFEVGEDIIIGVEEGGNQEMVDLVFEDQEQLVE